MANRIRGRFRGVSGGSTIWTPTEIPLSIWIDPSDLSTITSNGSGDVSQINDKSGNGFHVTQGTSTQQPKTGINNLNGKNVITFDGVDDVLETLVNFTELNNGYDIYAVMRFNDINASNDFFIGTQGGTGTNTSPHIGFRNTGTFTIAHWSNDANYTVSKNTDYNIFNPSFANPGSKLLVNGAVVGTNSSIPSTLNMNDKLSIGAAIGSHSDIDLGCLIVLPQTATLDIRQKLEGYLAHKWGLTNNLPNDHPYKYDGSLFGYPNGTVGNETGSGTG